MNKSLESLGGSWSPGEILGLKFEEIYSWSGYGAVVMNEVMVEVRESKEKFFNGG